MLSNATHKVATEHPRRRELLRRERDFSEAMADALASWRRRVMRGIGADSVGEIERRIMGTTQPLIDLVAEYLRRNAEWGVSEARAEIERDVLGVKRLDELLTGIAWDLANEDAAAWALWYADNLVGQFAQTTSSRIQRLVSAWIQNSEPFHVLRDRIIGDYMYSEERAYTIAVTETTRAYARGNQLAWERSGVIKRQRWNTANDEIVCPICGPLHNKVVDMGAAFAAGIDGPPAHPRCRCWLTPVVAEARDLPIGLANQPEVGVA